MFVKRGAKALAALAIGMGAAVPALADGHDVKYANDLWKAMEAANLVGMNAVFSAPYEGTAPHGAILDTIEGSATVGGHTGVVIVKRNYGPEGLEKEKVWDERAKHLKAVTVMFKREKGYDAETKDWFWVKYDAKGGVLKNPAGKALAGMVGKGADAGCIPCHSSAPGGDLVFNHDHYK